MLMADEDEQKKPEIDDSVTLDDEGEESTEGTTDAAAGTEHDTEGQLGDSEAVMSDQEPPKAPNKFKRVLLAYWHKKKWTLPVTVVILIGIIFAVPATRYPLLALGMKRNFTVEVVDSKTNTPVSGATIQLDGKTATTDSAGDATLQAKVGKRVLSISKQYYEHASVDVFVGLTTGKNKQSVQLVATGRQVPIKVVNKITGKPVADAEIKVLNTEAKTNTDGTATIVLPTGTATRSATITASGYNSLSGSVELTSSVVSANTFSLIPSGRIYFLSNLSGNIDVVSANLDGSGRKTVLAGTGSEDQNNTVLLASRDWQYLALLSKRDGGQYAKLFLINTSDDKVTTMDEGNATFNPVGWSGHYFVYTANQANVQQWQSGQNLIKSYDADTNKATQIDQTSAIGTQNDYASNGINFVDLVGNRIVYGLGWSTSYGSSSFLTGEKDTVMSADPDGTNKQDVRDFSISGSTQYTYVNALVYNPTTLYIQVSTGQTPVYYVYQSANNSVTQSNTVTDTAYNQLQQNYVTYLVSPSGSKTFWSEQRDGKNTLFVGDYYGSNGTQIATLSDYTTYGWYSDNYLLVEKNGSELYIMPTSGGQALKISDYYKPPRNFYGYGGGYGGL